MRATIEGQLFAGAETARERIGAISAFGGRVVSRLASHLSFLAGVACAAPAPAPPRTTEERASVAAERSEGAEAPAERVASAEACRYAELSVDGYLPSVTCLPAGVTEPLLVATHGAGGSPEWSCGYWRELTAGRVPLLCLRGKSLGRGSGGHYYPDHHWLDRALRAALEALKAQSGIEPRGAIYAGFSQGAIMGAAIMPDHARAFSRLVLIEGGYEYWSLGRARKFGEAPGQRVLFVCGTKWCSDHAKQPAQWLTQSGVEVRVEYAAGTGHTDGGAVRERVVERLDWLELSH